MQRNGGVGCDPGRPCCRYFSTNNTFAPPHLVGDLRFMFVRDPYSRLWSAYVDKFLLIDYWRTAGKAIVSLRKKKDNMTKCARDISFKEFVEFVSTRQSGAVLNEHWKPIQYQCSPCLYHPHVIGKIETFSQDSRYVLQLMNSSWILDSYDHEHHIYQEMSMLITYNFHVLKSSHYTNCTNATDLSRRLWKTFQINGYLPMETDFPDPGPAGINASRFQTLAFEAYRTRPSKSPAEWREQRVKAMQDAFKDISTETLQKIKNIYKIDFELFGYDPEPAFIFAGRKSSSKS